MFGDNIPFFQNKTFKELYQEEIEKLQLDSTLNKINTK